MKAFPRTEVEGISLPRIIIGSNRMLGFSHTSMSADSMIKKRCEKRRLFPISVNLSGQKRLNSSHG